MIADLIYDVGLHDGSDTAYYLWKGYRVVAIEANPLFAEQAVKRFAKEIAAGRLVVVNAGVGPEEGVVPFWVNERRTEWSSFLKRLGGRQGTPCHAIDVRCVRFRSILQQYGVPFYLKVDIEGSDIHCLRDLSADDLPRYVSTEAGGPARFESLCVLGYLGYNAFKCIEQRTYRAAPRPPKDETNPVPGAASTLHARDAASPRPRAATPDGWIFPEGSSGPFGEDTDGEWQELPELAYNWLHHALGYKDRGTLVPREWYDFHATKK